MKSTTSIKLAFGPSRRLALLGAILLPFCVKATQAAEPLDTAVAQLIDRSEKQAQLFNAGRMHEWYEHVGIGDGFILMEPFGGPSSQGFNVSEERLEALARTFRNGEATLELEQSYASNDMVVLVYIERQTGEVHGLPMQDWSLRVTQVFQRQDGDWRLVHRHADPLVRAISLEQTAALAAGRAVQAAE
jgi:ketosteroid isomerase-like protein